MKLLKSIILLIILISCNSDKIERTDYQYSADTKKAFLNFVYKGYQKDGKYFLAGCSKFFGNLEKEIKLKDSFYGMPDHHSSIQYTVAELNSDSIKFKFESKFSHHSFGENKTSIGTGFFSIECFDGKDIIDSFKIEGDEVNKESAKKHIAEGKFYFLFKPENKINFSGTDYKKDDCWLNKNKKYGFVDFYISDCMPIEKYYKQLEEYNNTVFKHLLVTKELAFKDYKEMKRAFDNEVSECRIEKRK